MPVFVVMLLCRDAGPVAHGPHDGHADTPSATTALVIRMRRVPRVLVLFSVLLQICCTTRRHARTSRRRLISIEPSSACPLARLPAVAPTR